jgi:hypothetical protein
MDLGKNECHVSQIFMLVENFGHKNTDPGPNLKLKVAYMKRGFSIIHKNKGN